MHYQIIMHAALVLSLATNVWLLLSLAMAYDLPGLLRKADERALANPLVRAAMQAKFHQHGITGGEEK